ncbi:hypothetical protein [Catalinimonas alkaloidigena]|nr:hypothetical protein [Catalinimonas alkaloidigena]
MVAQQNVRKPWPWYGWLGGALMGIFWYCSWALEGLRTQWAFFPLWLGYCLTIDALTVWRQGDSLLTRHPRAYVGLFLVSLPSWWLFELLNERAHYWYYDGREHFSDLAYFGLASLCFSTVVPAIFGTAEFVGTVRLPRWGIRVGQKRSTQVLFFVGGWLMLVTLLVWPKYGAALIWMSLYFILDPLNAWLGNRSLLHQTGKGNWRPVWALWISGLICGFFWEMWNFYSYPKWKYTIPFVDFWPVFEMPLLGYLGYLPFSLELFALYHLLVGWLAPSLRNYVQLESPAPVPYTVASR